MFKIKRKCLECGREYYISLELLNFWSIKYCDSDCAISNSV